MQLTVGKKIFGIALSVLLLMLVSAGTSITLTAKISQELHLIARRIVPLSESVSKTNVMMLEQGIVLQRLIGLIELPGNHLEAEREDEQIILVLEDRIEQEIQTGQQLLEELESAGADVESLQGRYEAIGRAVTQFKHYILQMNQLAETDNRQALLALLPELNRHQDAIDHQMGEFREEVEQLVSRSVNSADRNERWLLFSNTILTALACLVGLTFAALTTRMIITALTKLVRGTESVEQGKLDVVIELESRDEIGTLAQSFNHMVGELRVKERIKETFGKYMDPRIVNRLIEQQDLGSTGGEIRDMTVMFVDLQGFTSISEKLPPDELIEMINEFFTMVGDAVSAHHGVIDKFMGDAVMAYWGEPFTGKDEHAMLACRAALKIQRRLADFREKVREEINSGDEVLAIDLRVGISSGSMVVGNIGSEQSKNFTVMGDPVNLGSRLEGANKNYGTRILINEQARNLLDESLHCREIDIIRVKGKEEPIQVFEVLPADQWDAEQADTFQAGLSAYRSQQWDAAISAFSKLSGIAPACTYLKRIEILQQSPPPAEWDGVWTFTEK